MSLAAYQPPRVEVELGEETVSVSGLSLESITTLVRTHLPDLEALFDLMQAGDNLKGEDVMKLAAALVSQAPGFAANVIALGCGEPDQVAQAEKIPGPKQMELLVTIGNLTFQEVGGVKKSWEMITGLLGMKGADLKQGLSMVKKRQR